MNNAASEGTGHDHRPAVTVRGLTVDYLRPDGSTHRALDGLDLDLAPGRVTGLLGESGSGKSTLAAALLGMVPPEGRVVAGSIRIGDLEVVGLDERRLRPLRGAEVSLVPQDPAAALHPVLRVRTQLAEVLRAHGVREPAARSGRIADGLTAVGLGGDPRFADAFPHQLSGGQRQRVVLARALAPGPTVLVADEPVSAADAPLRLELLDLVRRLVVDHGAALLLIGHDPADLARVADRVVVMRDGRVVEHGDAASVWRRPRNPFTRELLAALPPLTGRSADALSHPDPPVLVAADGISRTYAAAGRTVRALEGVDLAVRAGRTVAVVGPSGAGKSTLARCLALHERPTSGRLEIAGHDPWTARGLARRRLRRRVQLVLQDAATAFHPRHTVHDAVGEPLAVFDPPPAADRRRRVAELLDEVELPAGLAHQRVARLSGGERQRVALARALAAEPSVLILDEALASLDLRSRARLMDLLRRLQDRHQLGYVVVSHDLATVADLADEIVLLADGVVVERAAPDALLRDPRHPEARRTVEAAHSLRRGLGG